MQTSGMVCDSRPQLNCGIRSLGEERAVQVHLLFGGDERDGRRGVALLGLVAEQQVRFNATDACVSVL
jgi:hypothetical protein